VLSCVNIGLAIDRSKVYNVVGLKVLTVVIMKSSVFWDIMYSPLKINGCFGGSHRLHLQGIRISQPKYQHEVGSKLHSTLSQKVEIYHIVN
jgi:hypothetical protein